MATAIAGIETGGGGGDETALFNAVNNNTCTDFVANAETLNLRRYAFYGCSTLKTVDLEKMSAKLHANGKLDLGGLIGANCFENCTGLEAIILPKLLSKIGTTNEVASNIWLGGSAFKGCTSLKEFCTEYTCGVSSASSAVFANCTALEKAIIPNFIMNGTAGYFSGCSSLEIVDFSITTVQTNCFQNCAKLKAVVLRSANLASLGNVNAFNGTPFASGGTGGTVYVPSALIESYRTATNWSTLYAAGTCNFVAIEGSEYE
jgi:hypothetical protein